LTRAIEAAASGDDDAALSHLDEALRLDPDNIVALRSRARIYARRGKIDPALADLDRAIKANGQDLGLYLQRLHIYTIARNYEAALRDADRFVELAPDAPTGYLVRTEALLSLRRYEEAKRAAETAHARSKGEGAHGPQARIEVAVRTDEFEQALRWVDEWIEREPASAEAHTLRARTLRGKGDYAGALAARTRAIALEPRLGGYYLYRAYTRVAGPKKDHRGAINDCTRAIHLNPWDVEAYALRGYCRWKLREYAAARRDLDEAIRIDPKAPEGYTGLAWMLATCPDAAQRDGKRALEHAKRANELTGRKEEAQLSTLAAAYAELGQFDEAVKWMTKALEDRYGWHVDKRKEAEDRLAAYRARKPWYDTR